MSYAQYLRQLLRPLGVYDVEGRYLSGELEAEGLAPVSYTHLTLPTTERV